MWDTCVYIVQFIAKIHTVELHLKTISLVNPLQYVKSYTVVLHTMSGLGPPHNRDHYYDCTDGLLHCTVCNMCGMYLHSSLDECQNCHFSEAICLLERSQDTMYCVIVCTHPQRLSIAYLMRLAATLAYLTM